MQTTKSTNRAKNALKKFVAVATTGAIAAIPLFGAISASEAQPRHAPAYGKRDKDRRNNRRNDRWDNRRHDRRRDNRWDKGRNDRRNDYRTFTGTVTGVRGNDKFDLRADGRTYNVYTSSRLPRNVDRNDIVRVYGVRSGSNDIRNARVSVIRNR